MIAVQRSSTRLVLAVALLVLVLVGLLAAGADARPSVPARQSWRDGEAETSGVTEGERREQHGQRQSLLGAGVEAADIIHVVRRQHQHDHTQQQQQPASPMQPVQQPVQPLVQQPIQQQPVRPPQNRYVITGVTTGQVQVRRNIRDLQKQFPDQFNMLLLGLVRMQQRNQADTISYFRLAGIHGVPASDWNGVTGADIKQGPGWCTHISNLFLTWHRPYVVLFEQVLVTAAQEAAREFPPGEQRDRYIAAADQLRLPYMDWAADPPPGENVLPNMFTEPTIQVTTRTGRAVINNPLYSYKFNPIDPELLFQPYIFWPETLRWPTTPGRDAKTQTERVHKEVNDNQPQMKQRLYQLITGNSNYTQVGTYAWQPETGPIAYDSLESMHDQMHGTIGGSNFGDMAMIPVSSFDPVFWFHHVMIDRSFAMWQELYPNSYVEPMVQKQGAYWYNQGATFDVKTPLKPFYSTANGTFWTSETVRYTKTFGYTYAELVNANATSVRAAINAQYGNFAANATSSQPRAPSEPGHTHAHPQNPSAPMRTLDSPAKQRYYQLNFRAPKNTVDKSFYIDFFLGAPASEDAGSWSADANRIGSQAVLSMDRAGTENVTITGVLPLNDRLERMVESGTLESLVEEPVVALLRSKIAWRVRTTDYQPIPLSEIPDFQVSFASIEVQAAKKASEFPKYIGEWKIHESVTAGKSGGLSDAAEI